jgi:hypothetical protein
VLPTTPFIEKLANHVAFFNSVGAKDHPVHEVALGERVAVSRLVSSHRANVVGDVPCDLITLDAGDRDEDDLKRARAVQLGDDRESMSRRQTGEIAPLCVGVRSAGSFDVRRDRSVDLRGFFRV